jgi:transposase
MKKTRAQRRREARMADAVRLRSEGASLRAIAAYLDVDHKTIASDLRKWDSLRQAGKVGNFPGEKSPKSGEFPPPEIPQAHSNIIEFRKRSA